GGGGGDEGGGGGGAGRVAGGRGTGGGGGRGVVRTARRGEGGPLLWGCLRVRLRHPRGGDGGGGGRDAAVGRGPVPRLVARLGRAADGRAATRARTRRRRVLPDGAACGVARPFHRSGRGARRARRTTP